MLAFKVRKPDGTPALRIGREVPAQDVNLAYIFVPPLRVEENIQVVDVSASLVENLVRLLRLESLVAPDFAGLLHYLNITPEGRFVYGPVAMPSPYFVLTDLFYNKVLDTGHALYYKYEVLHYDLPGLAGKYAGTSIAVVDGEGVELAPDKYYEIYLEETALPNVYRACIYTAFNTDQKQTYKVRYNKYADGLVLPGHEEILNGTSVYHRAAMEDVLSASSRAKIFAVQQTPEDGYRVYVPQAATVDPRRWVNFSWLLKGRGSDGKDYTFGWVSDRILPYTSLLEAEKADYNTDGTKKLTVENLGARDLLQKALPPEFPETVHISSYSVTADNPNVQAFVESELLPAKGKDLLSSPVWELPENSVVIDRPIEFIYTVFPEEFWGELEWDWEAFGSGVINAAVEWDTIEEVPVEIPFGWRLNYELTTTTSESVEVTDELLRSESLWQEFNKGSGSVGVWELDPGLRQIENKVNCSTLSGFIFKGDSEWIAKYGNPFTDAVEWEVDFYLEVPWTTEYTAGYSFSDDDCVGIIFAAKDTSNFCYFLWEGEGPAFRHTCEWQSQGRCLGVTGVKTCQSATGCPPPLDYWYLWPYVTGYQGKYVPQVGATGPVWHNPYVGLPGYTSRASGPADAATRYQNLLDYNNFYESFDIYTDGRKYGLSKAHKRIFKCRNGGLNYAHFNDWTRDGVGWYGGGQDDAGPGGWRYHRVLKDVSETDPLYPEGEFPETKNTEPGPNTYHVYLHVKKRPDNNVDVCIKINDRYFINTFAWDSSYPVYNDYGLSGCGSFGFFTFSQACRFKDITVRFASEKTGTITDTARFDYSDILGPENDVSNPKKISSSTIEQLKEDLFLDACNQLGFDPDETDINSANLSVVSRTDGIEVYVGSDGYVYAYISDRSKFITEIPVPVGDGAWVCRGMRYVSKSDSSDYMTHEYKVSDYYGAAAVSVPDVVSRQYLYFNDALTLMVNYAGDDNAPEDFQDLYCIQHDQLEDLPYSKGMPFKWGEISTAVWVKESAGVTLEFYHTDRLRVYLNDVLKYDRPGGQGSTTLSLRAGWNTVLLRYEDTDFNKTAQMVHVGADVERNNNSCVVMLRTLKSCLDETGVYYTVNSYIPGTYEWSTEENGKNLRGKGYAVYDETEQKWDISLDPPVLPPEPENAPGDVYDFTWEGVKCATPGVSMSLDGNTPRASVNVNPYKDIGQPATFSGTVQKDDGLKYMLDVGSVKDACKIPPDADPEHVRLTLKLGDIYGNNADGRVNLRWYNAGRFWVDQRDGENRSYLVKLEPGGQVTAWTNFQDLTAVSVMAIKFDELRRIHVELPAPLDVYLDNWYLRVKDGSFVYPIVLPSSANYEACPELQPYAGSEVNLFYTLPEYLRQPFDPDVPYVRQKGAVLQYIDGGVFRAAHKPLYVVERVVVNPGAPNEREVGVADVDRAKGLIYIEESVYPQDIVVADYVYENLYYEYRGCDVAGRFFHLNLNPSPGHSFTALVDGPGLVVPGDFPSAWRGVPEEVTSCRLLQLCFYLYLRPVAAFSGRELIPGSVRYNTLFHTTEKEYFDPDSPLYDPTAFLLARVYVRPNSTPQDVVILDTRSRGGGLADGYTHSDYWDIAMADGIAYPGQGVIIARFPRGILKENGGQFTREEVERAVRRYLAHGVHPAIEYF
ncbi:MAG: hypothetical protein AB1330_01175 [Bacillota bacterium]